MQLSVNQNKYFEALPYKIESFHTKSILRFSVLFLI